MTQSAAQAVGPVRGLGGFGGLVPSGAVARGADTLMAVLSVEHHADGAVLPLLILSEAPGLLGWDVAAGLRVRDDADRTYAVRPLAQQAGLGALQAAAWIEPGPPPEARTLYLTATGLVRTSMARGSGGVERPLSGGTWELEVDLVPARTGAPLPPDPSGDRPGPRPVRVPARAFSAFRDLVPVGQARLTEGAAVCLWALERYADRAVLTVATLTDEPNRAAPITSGRGHVEVWDDAGRRYEAAPIHGASRPGWSETSLEVAPAIAPGARALGVRLRDLPHEGGASAAGAPGLAGPFTFGISLPGARVLTPPR